MDPIYVTGHRNPDTDSIVAAIAYAALRNALGDWDYVPACLGQVSDETMRVLNKFGYEPPMRIFNVYTQVRDLDYEMPRPSSAPSPWARPGRRSRGRPTSPAWR